MVRMPAQFIYLLSDKRARTFGWSRGPALVVFRARIWKTYGGPIKRVQDACMYSVKGACTFGGPRSRILKTERACSRRVEV